MINLDVKNIALWSIKKKITIGVFFILFIWILWSIFGGVNPATAEIIGLPEGSIQVENDNGERVKIDVKIGNSDSNFSNVSKSVVNRTVLYSATNYSASAATIIKNVKVPIKVALFDKDGNLINIYNIPANSKKKINPQKEYQYTVMAKDNFFADNNISIEDNSKLLLDTLNKKSIE